MMNNSTSREHDLTEMTRKAGEVLSRYGNCAQASFAILQEEFDLDNAAILKGLEPFPGIAARGETCGAISGCLMALGLIFGSDRLEDVAKSSLPLAREFCSRFENEHGSTACGNILEAKLGSKCDFTNPTDVAQYVSSGGPSVCTEIVASAVQLAGAIITRKS